MTEKKALIVWGGWEGHTPLQSAGLVRDMLHGHGFAVTVDNSTESFADPELGTNDLIVPMITMSRIEKEELTNLLAAVRAGSGSQVLWPRQNCTASSIATRQSTPSRTTTAR